MITVNNQNMVNFIAELHRVNRFGLPNAVRSGLTEMAKDSSAAAKGGLKNQFTLMNTYTERSVTWDRATQRNIKDMESHVGSVQKYMKEQEEGFSTEASGQFGVALATRFAAGETGAGARTKTIRSRNYLQKLNPVKAFGFNFPVRKGGNPKSAVLIAAWRSIQQGSRVIFIDRRRDHWHRKTGFYKVIGGTKKNMDGMKIKLLYAADRKRTITKAHKWLDPVTDKIGGQVDEYYFKALDREMAKSKGRFV
jgi:hypothetical protein